MRERKSSCTTVVSPANPEAVAEAAKRSRMRGSRASSAAFVLAAATRAADSSLPMSLTRRALASSPQKFFEERLRPGEMECVEVLDARPVQVEQADARIVHSFTAHFSMASPPASGSRAT